MPGAAVTENSSTPPDQSRIRSGMMQYDIKKTKSVLRVGDFGRDREEKIKKEDRSLKCETCYIF